MIELIRSNISWLKDVFTIFFTGTATVVAILTYLRAKATVFQPIRTELIRKQSEILSDILTFISEQNESTKQLYDYWNLLSINISIILHDFSVNKMSDEEYKEINDKLGGWVLFHQPPDKTKFVYVVGNFDDFSETQSEIRSETLEARLALFLQSDSKQINTLFFSKDYMFAYKKISDYSDNPFLPKKIIEILIKIKYEGKLNLLLQIEETIIDHVKELVDLINSGNYTIEKERLLNRKSHEKFAEKRFQHENDLILLRDGIRQHLRIDEKW